MRKITRSAMVIPLLFVVSIVSIYLLTADDNRTRFQRINPNYQDRQAIREENRFNRINTARIQTEEGPHILRINSIRAGETTKEHLRHDSSIKIIKHEDNQESHYEKNHVTVKFMKGPGKNEIEGILKDIRGKMDEKMDTTFVFHSKRLSTSELVQYFSKKSNVEYAEPMYLYLQNQNDLPNDYLYIEQYQWNLPVIRTEAGWDLTRGKEEVIIAVVDTGVDLEHPDLKNRLTKGYNVVENNHYPDDDNGHGTHVAGIIASETNNLEGSAGITWYNRIMPIKSMESQGYGTSFNIAKGIIWAVKNGADVINLSLGNYEPSRLLRDAVQYAYDQNVVVVAATGNDNTSRSSYPAAYPEVIGVSAIDHNGRRAEFSNYGNYVDVTAPGVQIPSTYFHQQYAALSGTSMATPHVAGLAGLILSVNPDLTNREVMTIIKKTAYDLGIPGHDKEFGHGLIDVAKALNAAKEK